jgi:TonB-dependent SusC/RagA subfamily outer membrane receptor
VIFSFRTHDNPATGFVLSRFLSFAAIGILGLLLAGCGSSRSTADPGDADRVAIGYGDQERDAISGSVSTLDVETVMREKPVTTLAELLQGRISGVHVTAAPGGGLRIRIRGAMSFLGNASPLFIIDGIPVQPTSNGTLPMLNPYDIESITVLKDAASTAIYGSRGANGVIIIKTKLE